MVTCLHIPSSYFCNKDLSLIYTYVADTFEMVADEKKSVAQAAAFILRQTVACAQGSRDVNRIISPLHS